MKDLSRCVHQPEPPMAGFRSLGVGTERASTIVFDNAKAYAERSLRGPEGYTYGLHGTPTTKTLERQLSALEAGTHTVLVPSGQAAIAVILLTVLMPGDHVLIPDTVYPPVRGFCRNYLEPRGIEHSVYDPLCSPDELAGQFRPRTRLVWAESPGSTTMEVQDLPAILSATRPRGVMVGCDNTWATPLLCKPLALGADFAMEALTKYVAGHSDLLMGSVSVTDAALYRRLKDTMRMLGIGVSPDDVSLALRGLQTLGLRLAHSGRVALDFAAGLQSRESVARVLHPALPDAAGHSAWRRDFSGASGVFGVRLRELADGAIDAACDTLRLFQLGASWGGTHSLLVPMRIANDRTVTPWNGNDTILRISVGLEDPDDLWADLTAFFDRLETGMARP